MWPWRTTIPIIEDHPRLRRGVIRRAGGLNPVKVTYWSLKNYAPAPSIKVVGADGSFTIVDEGLATRVVLRDRWMVCPSCERLCRYLLRRDGWKCRRCSGCDYAVRHRFRTVPADW